MDEIDIALLERGKFGVGQSVHRKEDPKLVRGNGLYTDDLTLPGQLVAHVVRATVARAKIKGFDTTAAAAAKGVHAVFTAADFVAAGYGGPACKLPLKHRDGSAFEGEARPGFAADEVRHIGEPLAVVVADTAKLARDAAELIEVDLETLPATTDLAAATQPGAPQVSPAYPGNICLDYQFGDSAAVAEAFAKATHVVRLNLVQNRLACAPLEPRAAVAEYDGPTERFTLHVGSQGAFGLRRMLAADVLRIPPEKLRVLTYDVGGSFGMKIPAYPEYTAVLHAARELGRPVGWRDERSDSFLSDHQARDSLYDAELALDEDGNFLAVRVDVLGNMGGYVTFVGPMMSSLNIRKNTPGPYKTPLLEVRTRCVLTNTVPTGPYRGAGRPEGVYLMERLIDTAARQTGRDPVELRLQNLIPKEAMPFKAASDLIYDSGDFPRVLGRLVELADLDGYAARAQASAAKGLKRGRAVTCYLEVTADSMPEMGAIQFEDDGRVTMIAGTSDYGQGHASTYAQIVGPRLGLPFNSLDLVEKDSDVLLAGGGSGGSRSTMAASTTLLAAADQVEAQGRLWAAHVLEAAPTDIVFEDGTFTVIGTDKRVRLLDLAKQVRESAPVEGLPERLDASLTMDSPPSAYPNGAHACEVEIDPNTGVVTVDRYVSVNDFGTIVNPMLTRGQIQGGIVQGIGQALFENLVYDAEGQLLSGSFMDYTMPRADVSPSIVVEFEEVPATTNPLGVKGCGEAGATGAPPTVMAAILDALKDDGVTEMDMPATPLKIWTALNGA